MTTVFSYLIDRCTFTGADKLWLSSKTIKPQVDYYYTRFMILIHRFHCFHACNEIDNGIYYSICRLNNYKKVYQNITKSSNDLTIKRILFPFKYAKHLAIYDLGMPSML